MALCPLLLIPCVVSHFPLHAPDVIPNQHDAFKGTSQACETAERVQGWRGTDQEEVQEAFSHVHCTQFASVVIQLFFFFNGQWFRGVEERTRCTDRDWLSCLWDSVHCTWLSFTRTLMKDFPSWTITLSNLPLIWCYSVQLSRQNCVRKTQRGAELVNICHRMRFRKPIFPRGKDFWLWVIMAS